MLIKRRWVNDEADRTVVVRRDALANIIHSKISYSGVVTEPSILEGDGARLWMIKEIVIYKYNKIFKAGGLLNMCQMQSNEVIQLYN